MLTGSLVRGMSHPVLFDPLDVRPMSFEFGPLKSSTQ